MDLHLGLDGGGSGCRAVVADAAGRILGRASGGPANILSDPEGARANILAACAAAMAAAGVASVAAAGMGLAGANAAGTVDRLRAALPFARLRIETDAVTAALGALGPRDGIVAAIGTGSVFARRQGAAIRQIGGRGLVLGDEGSGAWLGRAALAAALRAEDGHAPLTPFLAGLIADHGGSLGVIAFARGAAPADFAAIAPRILVSDDPAARALVASAAAEIAAAIEVLQGGDRMPVVFLGGLGPAFRDRRAGRWPLAEPGGPALDGALMLAGGGA
ncbi:MAG TPA: BadF/BadG/BcrA/BcrD ATPase family protein [Paracoccaceae bacterium]|nr:BadF/BadG/BcrA/BcrD ATPase family protein [Paracoccaceae bacterium]HMO70639.1 BadF/BadG/BcrA/BcrD ATPase family protein [Paracoccaceae bacterium]